MTSLCSYSGNEVTGGEGQSPPKGMKKSRAFPPRSHHLGGFSGCKGILSLETGDKETASGEFVKISCDIRCGEQALPRG